MSNWLGESGPYSGSSTPQSEFPSVLPLNEATDLIEACGEAEILLGVDGTGSPVTVDLDAESPHVLVSAATGAGKSAVARSAAVQRLARGDLVVFLDAKRHSHRWAKPLSPNVHYAAEIPAIGDTLVNIGREVHRRNQVVDAWDGPIETAPVGPRIIVVFEEMNATTARLKTLDRGRERGEYTAMEGLSDVAFMGRAVKVHLISFAQLATYRASGGSEVIENYGYRVLIKYSPKAWRYLAESCGRPVAAPGEVGRGMVVYGSRATETQLLWVPEESAAPFVTDSVPAQRLARSLAGSRRNLSPAWRQSIGR